MIITSSMQLVINAGISPLVFKNVFQCFKPSNIYCSPALGSIALSSGLIENLRFFNVIAGYENKNRKYIADKAPDGDAIMELILILFPSPAGQLTSESDAKSNFGRLCTPEHVAALLNFANKVRIFLQTNDANEKKISLFKSNINKINSLLGQSILNYKQAIDGSFDKTFNGTDKNKLLTTIATAIFYENNNNFYPRYFVELVINAFFCHKFSDQEDLKTVLTNLDALRSSSILEAFRSNPAALLSGLSQDVEKNSSGFGNVHAINGLITKNDIGIAITKLRSKALLTLDDAWAIFNRTIFGRILPYDNRKNPISNGSTKFYNRETDLLSNETFQDCTEVALRHIVNFILYDKAIDSFNFSFLDEHMQGRDNPYIENFKNFYKIQTPDKANAGDIVIRSTWNKVVAQIKGITYLKKGKANEIQPGMINMMRVFKTLFDLELAPEPLYNPANKEESLTQAGAWIEEGFKKLCSALNKNYTVETILSSLSLNLTTDDIIGNITLEFHDNQNKTLFRSNLHVMNHHMEINHLEIPENDFISLAEGDITTLQNIFPHSKSAVDSLLLFINKEIQKPSLSHLQQSVNQALAHISPLFQLFTETLNDSSSITKALTIMSNQIELNSIPIDRAKNILINLLEKFPWHDTTILQRSMPLIRRLKELAETNNVFLDIIKNNIHGLALSSDDDRNLLEFFTRILYLCAANQISITNLDLSTCPELQELTLYAAKKLTSLDFPQEMPNLKIINLVESGIQMLTLPSCPNLIEINLIKTTQLTKLILPQEINKLKELKLNGSAITDLTLSICPELKELSLVGTKNLQSLNLPQEMKSLQTLNVGNSAIQNLILPLCSQLKKLQLHATPNLKNLIFSHPMDSLETIDLSASAIKKLLLPECPQLHTLTLRNTKNLNDLQFPQEMQNLIYLDLGNSAIQKLSLPACPQLKEIDLLNTGNMLVLEFLGKMNNLEIIKSHRSNVQQIIGYNLCEKMMDNQWPAGATLIKSLSE